ncbi:MAG TPA: EAL domain-containing protein, partial [Nocardioidaceae bacterium]|nr:EAL domain-containing protein [Nocardioidaceae bacterium]
DRAAAFSAAVLAASPDAIVVDELISGRSVYASRMAAEIVGETAGVTDVALASAGAQPEDQHRLAEALAAVGDLSDGQVLQVRYRSRDAESGHRWLSRRITPFRRDEDGRPVEILSVVRDVSDIVAAEETLTHAALHDPLTGLPNRTLLSDRLTGALFRARRHQQEVAVLFCDLDGFKRVNDSTGHAAGDAVLVETARRLRDCLRSLDTVARVGGDEFVVIVEPLDHGDTVPMPTARQLGESVARRIVATVGKPVVVGETSQSITVSVGLAFAGGAGDAEMTAEDVLRDADAAMYRAKSRGGDRFEVCDPGLQSDLTERGRVASLLRHAIASSSDGVDSPGMSTAPPRGRATCAGALDVAYQPIYDADTGRLAGFEALARLSDSGGTPVPPDVFINVAEEIGLIRPLGMQVLKQACGALARWRSTLPDADHLTMAINLSARQAHHPDLVDEVLAALAEEHLPPDKIVLELTESVLIQAGPSTVKTFQTLHDAGVGIHIDDFGTGYSSLRYLVEFPVTAVKIDRSFTAGLPDDPTSLSIVRAVAGLARDLNLGCTVEGIETVEQQSSLPDGVLLQGYLLGRPGPASSAEQTILAHQTAK